MKIREIRLQSGKFAYKTGFSFTKWESRLQNEIFIYKEGLLSYKRDSRSTFHQCENKENEIAAYKEYAAILEKKLAELKA